ncbi:UDP-N-acetylmuramoyl-tripeptide--D-alanyl-D-alanine ligase [Sulfurivirga caldicuralii]|uniref:UDP-N-acetylmuramoyl-tripeptide--D-alanyl-D-alanine ligase n=1 Tax=Sulfurivirga caldicuralii TaxID=364032 RepID=A0A1N6DVH4_9GAMM|nr:UDP-N-acetylmuramoyl-tripeptide--D-alanyl-D-alanine ligase [Sulfurivirga caldicuralii]SIN74789.1 UDP-N-acetylmuramoyl-tripeptide--D-alanyl-D-alanine ligase [Sulfurivirga caldicuralii]
MGEGLNLDLQAASQAFGGRWLNGPPQTLIQRVQTDSRQVQPGDLFVALKGARFDAHAFLPQVMAAGAAAAMVSAVDPALLLPQWVVKDTRAGLGSLAAWHAQQLNTRRVAVTGSNGKTSVKEMLAQVLSRVGDTLATQGNLNNDIGVPLTLLRLRAHHRFAVIETGANHVGEIARLGQWVRPEGGIITQAAPAHVGEFGGLHAIVRAKGELIDTVQPGGWIVLNRDSTGFAYWYSRARQRSLAIYTFGRHADVQVRIASVQQRRGGLEGVLDVSGEQLPFSLPLWGLHHAHNLAAVVAAVRAMGLSATAAIEALMGFRGAPGRMQPIALRGGGVLMDDSYNANPASVRAAVETLIRTGAPVAVCLGALAELGEESEVIHAELGRWLAEQGVQALWTFGQGAAPAATAFGAHGSLHEDHAAVGEAVAAWLAAHPQGMVLVKGSRSAAMERVIEYLRSEHADLFD